MTTAGKTKLFTLLGDYPVTLPIKQGQVPSDLVEFEFADFKVANTGFKPLVREAKFDLGELAIVTLSAGQGLQQTIRANPSGGGGACSASHNRLQ